MNRHLKTSGVPLCRIVRLTRAHRLMNYSVWLVVMSSRKSRIQLSFVTTFVIVLFFLLDILYRFSATSFKAGPVGHARIVSSLHSNGDFRS